MNELCTFKKIGQILKKIEREKTHHRYSFFQGMYLIQYLTKTYVCIVKNELQTPNYMLEKKSNNFDFI